MWTTREVEETNSVENQSRGLCEIVTGVPVKINSELLYLKKQY